MSVTLRHEFAVSTLCPANVAMQSPVRQELRRHFHEFPRFTGLNTHYPMQRTRLVG